MTTKGGAQHTELHMRCTIRLVLTPQLPYVDLTAYQRLLHDIINQLTKTDLIQIPKLEIHVISKSQGFDCR